MTLILEGIAQAQKAIKPLYLETSTRANSRYYKNKGFEHHHTVTLDNSNEVEIFMMRLM